MTYFDSSTTVCSVTNTNQLSAQACRPPALALNINGIRTAMKARGLTTIDQLSECLGTGRTMTHEAMSGKRQPSPSLIAAVKSRLGLPWDFVVEVVE